MATNSYQSSKSTLDLDQLFKKLNKNSSLNDVRLKRQISIDKKRYEEGLALENSLNHENNSSNETETTTNEIKIENMFDLARVKIEDLNNNVIENELNGLVGNNLTISEFVNANLIKNEPQDDINNLREIRNDDVILCDDSDSDSDDADADDDDDDDDDDVIIIDKDEFTRELRDKLINLNINKIIKVEETNNELVNVKEELIDNDIIIEPEPTTTTTTTILFDSVLGTISGQNDKFINELAQQLATNLNLPVEFMTLEEFNRYKENQAFMTENFESNNNTESEVLLTNNEAEGSGDGVDAKNGTIKIKGQALIQYLFGDCSDIYKNAIRRESTLSDLETLFQNLQNKRKKNPRDVGYYITQKKLRKLAYQRQSRKLKNHLVEIENNHDEIITHLYIDQINMNQNFTDANYIVIDVTLYKNFLYSCTLSGRCSVYNLNNHKLIHSTFIKEGAQFIQPLYNDSRFYLSVIIGGGNGGYDNNPKSFLHIYDPVLKHKRYTIDLKSQIRCVVFRYHRLYCGLNSGEVVSLNRNLNNLDKPIKVTDKKISSIGVALINFQKLLLVGAYDGKIHILHTKTKMGFDYENRNEYLHGHKMAPLSIKCYKELVYSCSADCHILIHCLQTHRLVSKIKFNTPITSLAIQQSYILCSGADGLIRCYSLEDPKNLKLCQQYYGYNKNARIMCIKCERNSVFYGDDKGNVESIEFNLKKVKICKFGGCNQPFATNAYLLQHLYNSHFDYDENNKQENTNQSSKIIQCEWENCNQLIEFNTLKFHLLRHF